jgi:ABC-2 type transport system permease protein
VLSVAAMLGLGFLVGAALPSVRVAYPVTMAVFMPMIYLSGATIPTEVMSPGVRTIGSWMPLRFAVDLLQGAWDGAPATELVRSAAVLVAVAVASCALAVRFFRWAPAR